MAMAEKKEYLVLGLMSGTSLDGVDLALCRFTENGSNLNYELLEAETTFTLSENPNFSFSFDPHESGVLRAEMTDSQHNTSRVETVIQGPG